MPYMPTSKVPDFDFYTDPDDGPWERCPVCLVNPKIWEFDNGRYAHCGCLDDWNMYQGRTIAAESIMDKVRRGASLDSHFGELKTAWYAWCRYAGAFERE